MLSVADPEIVPTVAVIVVEPAPTPKAKPKLLAALLMLPTAAFDDVQTTDSSVSVLPLLNVPVAANCSASPTPMELLPGVTAIDTSPDGVKLLG